MLINQRLYVQHGFPVRVIARSRRIRRRSGRTLFRTTLALAVGVLIAISFSMYNHNVHAQLAASNQPMVTHQPVDTLVILPVSSNKVSQLAPGVIEEVEETVLPKAKPAGESKSIKKPMQFNGKNVKPYKVIRLRVTGYCAGACCCGKHADGKTASGYPIWVNHGNLVAADTRLLPFGTLVSIPGYNNNQPVPVLDRGGKIKGYRLDLLFPTHAQAKQWGAQYVNVTIWKRQ